MEVLQQGARYKFTFYLHTYFFNGSLSSALSLSLSLSLSGSGRLYERPFVFHSLYPVDDHNVLLPYHPMSP